MTSSSSTSNKNENPLHQNGFQNPLLLGSGSFTRKLILNEMKIPYHKIVRSIDEKILGDRSPGSDPSMLVTLLAKAKAQHLLEGIVKVNYNKNDDENNDSSCMELTDIEKSSLKLPKTQHPDEGWIVLTADQVVTHNQHILEKPTSIEQAQEFVNGYASIPPATVGSCYLTHIPSGIQVGGVDTATIYFKDTIKEKRYDEGRMDIVQKLVELGEPIMSCAGGLMVEHELTKEHIERIDGTEDSVMGLSKDLVLRLLQELKGKLEEYQKDQET